MVKKNSEAHAAPQSSKETDSDSDSNSSSSEGEGSPSTPPPPSDADKKPAALKKPAEPAAEKEANSDSDSDDSDSPVKLIASKPIDDGSKLRKPRSKPNHKPFNPTPFTPKASAKRAPPAEDQKDSKKPKTEKREGGGAEEEGKKSILFQRLWSDDDEIAILKGMLEYKEKKGVDPMADANVFHDFIKKSLHISFDRTQLVSKIRRLKKRYENSAGRKTFNAHETVALELSKKIWGNDLQSSKLDRQTKSNLKSPSKMSKIATNGAAASSGWMKNAGNAGSGQELEDKSVKLIGKASISMGLDESIVKVGLRLCNEDKKAEIEEKWKQLHLEESNIFLRKLDLAREENKMIIEALKSGEK